MGSLSGYAAALAADPAGVVAVLLAVVAVVMAVSGIIHLVSQLGPQSRSEPFDPSPAVRIVVGAGLSLLAVGIVS